MIVLNGAQGLSEALAQALSQGVAGLQLARGILGGSNAAAAGGGGSPAKTSGVAEVSSKTGPPSES